jgi:hypothetical protein
MERNELLILLKTTKIKTKQNRIKIKTKQKIDDFKKMI